MLRPSRLPLALLAALLTAGGCESILIGDDPRDSPESNFQILWDEFDRWYGGFTVRDVNWAAWYAEYRPRVTPATSRTELWEIVKEMLVHLDDPHVFIEDPATRRSYHTANPLGLPDPLDLGLVLDVYLGGTHEIAGGGRLFFGEPVDGIGYLYIADFEHDPDDPFFRKLADWIRDMDFVVSRFERMRGVIVDVRSNHGGDGINDAYAAGVFADQKRFVFTVQTRNGPLHSDFDEPIRRYVEPMGPRQLLVPIVLLTDRESTSAAESFALRMTALPHVTHMGEASAGGLSSTSLKRYSPNGWIYNFSHQLVLTPDGNSPEGIGVVPSIPVTNTKADSEARRDRMLECAIAYLEAGAPGGPYSCS